MSALTLDSMILSIRMVELNWFRCKRDVQKRPMDAAKETYSCGKRDLLNTYSDLVRRQRSPADDFECQMITWN